MTRTPIKDFYGKLKGHIEEDNNGNQIAKDFYGRIKGFYKKNENITTDFYGRKIAYGNILASLLYQD